MVTDLNYTCMLFSYIVLGRTFMSSSVHKSNGSTYSTMLTFNHEVFFKGVTNLVNRGSCVFKHITVTTIKLTCFDLSPHQTSYMTTLKGVMHVHTRTYPLEVRVKFFAGREQRLTLNSIPEPKQSDGKSVTSMYVLKIHACTHKF